MNKKALIIGICSVIMAFAAVAGEAAASLVRNGTFDAVKDGKPQYWNTNKFVTATQKAEGGYSLLFQTNGNCFQSLTTKELWQKPEPRFIKVTLKASGTGKLVVSFYNYSDTPDATAKHGYKRSFLPSTKAAEFVLTEAPQTFECEYEIKANQWAALAIFLGKGNAEVDDVTVTLKAPAAAK